jgi:hypothetical protein
MRNFEQKLQELVLSIDDLSIKLKNEIAEFLAGRNRMFSVPPPRHDV